MTASALPASALRPTLVAIGAITCVEFVENGMAMFAASQIVAGLGLTAGEFALAYTLYGVGAIVMLYKHRWMVERLGYRRFAALSLLALALGSLLCGLADGLPLFACGRLLQGLGGATFFTAGRMAINELPETARPLGMLTFIGSLLGGSAVAPLLAGVLLELAGWRALFLAILPLTALSAAFGLRCLPERLTPPAQRSREHWGWLLWMCLGVFGLQFAIQAFGTGSAGLRGIAALAGISMLVLLAFAWRQWRNERPIIDYRALFQWRYLLGLGLYFCGYALIGASGLMVPIMLHSGLGLPLLLTAAIASGGMLFSVGMALGHVALTRRWPRHRLYMLGGLAFYGLGCLLLALNDGSARGQVLLAVLGLSLGVPLFVGPVAMGTFAELHARVFSHGYQVKNIVRQLGLSSSVAGLSWLLHRLEVDPDFLSRALELLPLAPDFGSGLPAPLAASKLIFTALAAGIAPIACLVLGQRIFR